MFESILIKQNKISESKIDLGVMCESLVFYRKTIFLLDKFTVKQFIDSIEFEKLQEYVKNGTIELLIRNVALGPAVFNINGQKAYSPLIAKSPAFDLQPYIYDTFKNKGLSESDANAKTNSFLELCNQMEYAQGFDRILVSEWENETLLTAQMKAYIHSYLPTLDLSDLQVQLQNKVQSPLGGSNYLFKSNYDLDELNTKYSELLPQGHSFSWNDFLLKFIESSGDLHLASNFNSEIYTDPYHLPFMRNRVNDLILNIDGSKKEIDIFQTVVLEEYKPIRGVINSGEKSFSDFEKVLDDSLKFKKWLKDADKDTSLIKSYYEEISKTNWINKRKVKAARFGLFTGIGIVGDMLAGGIPIGSAISSASDNYLIPKLTKGWKPNQFIDDTVKPFLKSPEKE